MGKHDSHIIHGNSREAYRGLDISEREQEVLTIFERATHPLTDRQVCRALRKTDMNYVRPRITTLLQKQVLEEKGTVRDVDTGRRVRRCVIAPYLRPENQLGLF